MGLISAWNRQPIGRRRFLKTGFLGAAGLAVYSGEVERHWLEVTEIQIKLPNLPDGFDGVRIAHLSDIHMDEFTEHFFLRYVVEKVNSLHPDVVLLTGDYCSVGPFGQDAAVDAAWQCGNILKDLECEERYAVLGNHDAYVGSNEVSEALTYNNIVMLNNAYLPLERNGGRLWLAGLMDPVTGGAKPELAAPPIIRAKPNEPIVLMCHAPDYVDDLLPYTVGKAIDLVLSGHTHGGQVRLPFFGPLTLPSMGQKYVEGLFKLGRMQLYVTRGIGTVGVPFRFDCPPELTMITLQRG
jgi:predicted MPP superfamily phosphohydrolase